MGDEHPVAGLEEAERRMLGLLRELSRLTPLVEHVGGPGNVVETFRAYVAAVHRALGEREPSPDTTSQGSTGAGFATPAKTASAELEPEGAGAALLPSPPDTGEDRSEPPPGWKWHEERDLDDGTWRVTGWCEPDLPALADLRRAWEYNDAAAAPWRERAERAEHALAQIEADRHDRLGYECPDCGEPVCNHVVLRERQARERAERDEALERGRAEGVAACVAALHNPIGYVGHGSPMWLLTQGFGRYLYSLDVDGTALARLLAEAREEGYLRGCSEAEEKWRIIADRLKREAAARALEEAREKLMGGHATYRRPGKDEPWPVVAEGDVLAWLAEEIAALRTTTEDEP